MPVEPCPELLFSHWARVGAVTPGLSPMVTVGGPRRRTGSRFPSLGREFGSGDLVVAEGLGDEGAGISRTCSRIAEARPIAPEYDQDNGPGDRALTAWINGFPTGRPV